MTAREILDKAANLRHAIVIRDGKPVMLGDNPPQWLVDEARAHKSEITFILADSERKRLVAEAEQLRTALDDVTRPIEERETEIPRYRAMLDRIEELESVLGGLDDDERQWFAEGWILIHSSILGGVVCIVREASIEPPAGARAYPRYTFAEVQALDGMSDEQIREADRVRSIFRGEVVEHDRNDHEEATR